ncbi:UNVERIFIED_CONTAM: Retrovirus-related Pol polyprotein from type-2 retrotransposable element R2DM [Sesamum radiatum]|uniref:Retrovirus-related Pol polyprotein from type-2 retrotransposable element R2DM n=1 Tax=Sesamum radiatum TaxID=300843 RepID=A0AAW2WH12_SESRA
MDGAMAESILHLLTPRTSDHLPLVLKGDSQNVQVSMFRFDNYLAISHGFLASVHTIWQHPVISTPMYSVSRKLEALKPVFRQQRRNKGDLAMNVKLAAGFLEVAQKLLQIDRHNSLLLRLEHYCRLVYLKATKLEHVMLRQRAKLQWSKGGDQCSKVFFRRVATRRANKRIFQISDNDSHVQTDPTTINSVFVAYFQGLLGGERTVRVLDLHYLRPWARHILTEEEARALVRPVTIDDVKTIMFDIEEDKSPGPDGFSLGFYKAAWPIVGEEISKAIMDFFNTDRCALKVDLRKAYDTVEWDFLFATLQMFGFPVVFIRWIEECVTSAHFSVYVNGGVHGFFAGARGLRQGDPMSPYLFELKLFQLSFADDLLLLCKADVRSVNLFRRALDLFASLSCLHTNPQKSQLIISKAASELQDTLLATLGFQEGHLPVRASSVNQICLGLLGGTSSSGYLKVAWEVVCRPVEEGGQGIKDIFALNRALMSKHLWAVIKQDQTSIWVDWIIQIRLRDCSIWTVKENKGAWGWRKMFILRHTLLSHIHFLVGDGTSFSLWHDPWHPLGPFIIRFPRGPQLTNTGLLDKLNVVMANEGTDRIIWKSNDGSFTTMAAYALFHPPGPKVGWSSLLLGPFKIPKNCFILWLAILGRLSTLDKPWLQHVGGNCILCSDGCP